MPTIDEIAPPLADLLASVLSDSYEKNYRYFLGWEQKALRWMIAYMDQEERQPINAWTATFCDLNRELILSDRHGPIDFNLRAYCERLEQTEKG